METLNGIRGFREKHKPLYNCTPDSFQTHALNSSTHFSQEERRKNVSDCTKLHSLPTRGVSGEPLVGSNDSERHKPLHICMSNRFI